MGTRVAIPSVQNAFLRSQEFNSASWGKASCSIIADAITAPDGTTTGDRWVEGVAGDGNVAHQLQQDAGSAVTLGLGIFATLSFFAQPNGRDWVILGGSGGGAIAWVNVATSTVGTVVGSNAAASIESASNWITGADAAWKRLWLAYRVVDNGVPYFDFFRLATADGNVSYVGDGASGMYIWGAQLVQANWPGQPQATTGSAVNTGPIRSIP